MTPSEILGTWQNYDQKETHQELLTLYSYGDGGGGHTRAMLENMQLMADFPGLPRLSGGYVGGFMDRLEGAGDWRNGTIQPAYDLNDPCRILPVSSANTARANAGALVRLPSLVSVDRPNVILETVKQAEDGQGLVVRLFENERTRGIVTVQCGFSVRQAFVCNLLEECQQEIPVRDRKIEIPIKPFQIITLRLIYE